MQGFIWVYILPEDVQGINCTDLTTGNNLFHLKIFKIIDFQNMLSRQLVFTFLFFVVLITCGENVPIFEIESSGCIHPLDEIVMKLSK